MLENKLTELPLVFKEALACHEGLRRLGFKPEEIYIILTEGWLLVSLRAQEKEFNIELGETDVNEDEFPRFWGQVVERYNSGPIEEVTSLWDASYIKKHFEEVAVMIRRKGILLPSLAN